MRTNAVVNGVFERFGAGEELQLTALFLRRRARTPWCRRRAAPARDAFGRFGHEHVAGGQPQLEVHRLQHQVARRELFFRVQRQAMQALDRREAILRHDAPRLAADVIAARAADVEPPRGDAAARAGFDEDLDDQPIAFAGQRALQRRAVAFLDDDARDALRNHGVEELDVA